jgi:hypothetical protein
MRPPSLGGDELLDSLELQPAADMDELLPEAPELRMGPEGIPSDESEEVETVDLDEAFTPAPLAPPSPPATEAQKARTTLVSGPKETDDLRRRISRPSIPELNLDELNEEDEEIEELTFEPEPLPVRTPPPSPPPHPAPQPAVRMDTLPPGTRAVAAKRDSPPPVVASVKVAPSEPGRDVPAVATAPVSVRLPGTHGQTDVSIPVEVTLGRGTAQVTIHLRLILNLNVQQ